MKKILVFLFALALAPIWVQGQDDKNEKKEKENARLERMFNTTIDENDNNTKKSNNSARNDTITKEGFGLKVDSINLIPSVRQFPDIRNYYVECYEKITSRYGLWKGIGKPLTPTQRSHISRYYKLMRPIVSSANAPFTHLQIVDSYGRLTTNHNYGPLLANPFGNDEGIDIIWEIELEDICQSEKIINNGVLIQENLYDENGNLILQFYPTFSSKNQIFGHYTDPNGVLAHLRDDEDAAYISIELDDRGYVSRVAFTDEQGQLKRNGDGVFVQLFDNDKEGNVLCTHSANALGQATLDDWGNCGWRYTYDKQGRTLTASCVDQYGQSMRMPSKKTKTDVWNMKYTYDKWGNELTRTFYDSLWQPDTTSRGIHRYVFTYNNHGKTTSCRAEGLNNQLVDFDDDLAQWENQYDEKGNLLLTVNRNKERHFCSDGDCLDIYDYFKGKRTMMRKYNTTDGTDTILNYKCVYHLDADTTWNYKREYINIEQYDQKHRLINDAYYDMSFHPISNSGWHKCVYSYFEIPQHSIKTIQYINDKGLPADIKEEDYWRDYNKKVTEVDSVTRAITYSEWDGDKLLEKYQNTWNEDYSQTVRLSYYDSIGCRGRTFKADAFFYEAERVRDPRGNNIVWCGLNEFGEPSYIQSGDWKSANLYCFNVLGDSHYYDENGDTIPNNIKERIKYKENLYKSFCIELIDSCAYRNGLRTGDLIVRYGDWYYCTPKAESAYYWLNMLCYETVLKASIKKTVTVMRHDPTTKISQLVDLELPAGSPQQLGFMYHMYFMTTREVERYNQIIADAKFIEISEENEAIDRIDFIFPNKIGNKNNKTVFLNGFRENAVVLAWEAYLDSVPYFFSCNNKVIDNEQVFSQPYDSIALYYTVDGNTVKRYVFLNDDFRLYVRRSSTKMTDGSIIYALADSLQAAFDELHPRQHVSLTPQQAAKKILQIPGSTLKSNDGSDFIKYGFGQITGYDRVSIELDSLSYKQKFQVQDIFLHLDYSDYFALLNDDYDFYGHLKKNIIDEFSWYSIENHSISFLYGNLEFQNKEAAVLTMTSDNSMQLKQGNYILFKFDEWKMGMRSSELNQAKKNHSSNPCQIVIAPVLEKNSRHILGSSMKLSLSYEDMDSVDFEWKEMPDNIIYKALKRSKRIK